MKKIILSISIFIGLILICNISNATTITVSPAEPKVGDTVTVTVTVPNVHTSSVTANVSGVVSGTIKVVGGDLSGAAKTYSKSGTYTCSKEGNINIEVTSDSSAVLNGQYVDVTAKKTVTVKAKEVVNTGTQPTTGTTTTTETTKKSSNANLTNLGINPYDFKGFKSNTTEYSVEVPNSVSSVKVYATPAKGATVKGEGTVNLAEGNNTVKVVVTAEDGKTTKTYTLTIKRKTSAEETQNAGEARLKTLGIKPEQYDFTGFKSDTMEYSVEVPNEVEEVEVYATAINSNAQITGTGMITLKEGENALKIEVIAEDGTQKTYTLNVTRKETDAVSGTNEDKLGLSELSIEGIDINPSFKSSIYEYTATITKVMVGDFLNITAKANDETATVEIIGNENLQDGENIITILVKNDATNENATYQITVNKQVEAEIIEKTSWLKPSTWGKEEKIKVAIILILIVLIIGAIILKIKIGKENNSNEEREFPGAEELDKAIAEHQELSTEEDENVMTDNLEDGIKSESELNYIQEIAESRFENEENKEEFQEVKTKRKGRHF